MKIVDETAIKTETMYEENNTVYTTGDEPTENPVVQAIFGLIYFIIFTLGMFGNTLVCYVVGRNRAMQTVTNLFISNLALSDILLCVLCVPFTPLYTFFGRWVFGKVLCHTVAVAQGTSVYITTLTLTAIAVDRFYVIIYPFRRRMRPVTCLTIVCLIWAISFLATLPYGIYMVNQMEDGVLYCEEEWPSTYARQIFGGITFALQFVVPFAVITYCYAKISLKLEQQSRVKPGCKNSRKEADDRERKRRTNRMLVAMVAVFGISWMPLNLVNLTNDIYLPVTNWPYFRLFFFFVHALAMSSTCYNPFLYAWLNENFRREFKQVLPCWRAADPQATLGPSAAGHSAQTLLQTSNTLLPDVVSTESDQTPSAPPLAASYSVNDNQVRISGVGTTDVDSSS